MMNGLAAAVHSKSIIFECRIAIMHNTHLGLVVAVIVGLAHTTLVVDELISAPRVLEMAKVGRPKVGELRPSTNAQALPTRVEASRSDAFA